MRAVRLNEVPPYTRSSWKIFRVYLAMFIPTVALGIFLFPSKWSGTPICLAMVAYYLWVCHSLGRECSSRGHQP